MGLVLFVVFFRGVLCCFVLATNFGQAARLLWPGVSHYSGGYLSVRAMAKFTRHLFAFCLAYASTTFGVGERYRLAPRLLPELKLRWNFWLSRML